LIASTNLFTARRILNVHELCLGASSASYPVKAVEFLKGIELEGNMFNNFESGGYIDWHLYPLKKAFIDGTIGIYGKNLWKDYLNALQGEMLPDELVQKYNIGYFLLMHRYPDSRILVKELNQKNTEWKLIYLDEVALIFVRNIPEHHGIIKRYQVIPEQIYRPILKRADKGSVRYLVYLAEVAQALGEFQEAGRLYMKALEFCPQDAELFHRLGVINYEAGLISEATVAYQKALALRPGYFGTHYSLAMCLVKNVDYIGAIAEFKECLKFNPNYAAGHYNLAVAYTMVRPCQIELAYQHLHRAVQLGFKPDPRFMEYLKKISGP